jgi:hypothetical protein
MWREFGISSTAECTKRYYMGMRPRGKAKKPNNKSPRKNVSSECISGSCGEIP